MTFLEHGPPTSELLSPQQREKHDRLVEAGWAPTAFGHFSRELDLAHPNGRRCTVLPDGEIEAVELA